MTPEEIKKYFDEKINKEIDNNSWKHTRLTVLSTIAIAVITSSVALITVLLTNTSSLEKVKLQIDAQYTQKQMEFNEKRKDSLYTEEYKEVRKKIMLLSNQLSLFTFNATTEESFALNTKFVEKMKKIQFTFIMQQTFDEIVASINDEKKQQLLISRYVQLSIVWIDFQNKQIESILKVNKENRNKILSESITISVEFVLQTNQLINLLQQYTLEEFENKINKE